MKLRHNPASPYVRKVMVVAHELGLADRIELLSTAVSPVETNPTLAAENPLMKIPS
jgi:glutathione S-transferase